MVVPEGDLSTGDMREALTVLLGDQAKAKAQLHEVWMAPTRGQTDRAFDQFVQIYRAKHPKATDKLFADRDALLAFYDFPTEHWPHLRTTNPIESTFVTVPHRTTRTKNCVSRSTFLGLAFKLVQEAEKSWRQIRGAEHIAELMDGVVFKDGEPIVVLDPTRTRLEIAATTVAADLEGFAGSGRYQNAGQALKFAA